MSATESGNTSTGIIDAPAAVSRLQQGTRTTLKVAGLLDFSARSGIQLPPRWPDELDVEVLDLTGRDIRQLPSALSAWELRLCDTPLVELPEDLSVECRLDLSGCDRLERLPSGLTVGTLILRNCTALTALPERLDVWFLDLTGCWAFAGWPTRCRIHGGRLQLRGCTALSQLPPGVTTLSALNVRDCPRLETLPDDLVVTGWLDLAHSGLTRESQLPAGLERTQLRWAGVNVDRRIAFHPESISVDEVLSEKNAERRRVLLDRYGFGRFLQDSRASRLDNDRDPGGERQLLRVAIQGDEDLVALSCHCPSTGRQYLIRVPPTTRSCHQAAAWIAGFDDPAAYRPIRET